MGFLTGAGDPIRTDDLLITSELLYQLSHSSIYEKAKPAFCLWKILPSDPRVMSPTSWETVRDMVDSSGIIANKPAAVKGKSESRRKFPRRDAALKQLPQLVAGHH